MSEERIYLQSDVDLGFTTPPETKPDPKNPKPQGFKEESAFGTWEHTPEDKNKGKGFHESF